MRLTDNPMWLSALEQSEGVAVSVWLKRVDMQIFFMTPMQNDKCVDVQKLNLQLRLKT